MSLYSDDPEFKKVFDAYAKEVFEFIKKQLEDYLEKFISAWVEEELKKMGYLKKNKKEKSCKKQ